MTRLKTVSIEQSVEVKRKVSLGVTAVFITQFVSFLFIKTSNIAQPGIIASETADQYQPRLTAFSMTPYIHLT